MKPSQTRRRTSARLLGLTLGSAAVALIPSAALGADASSPTIRAAIGPDGSVHSVKQYSSDGSASSFSGKLPVTLKISRTTSGSASTYTYHVENTTSQTQTIHYTDTAGREHHTSATLQLPLVAQLGVDVPASMTNLSASNATVTTSPDGTRHVLWNLVLFTPLGSAAQDVTFTATGKGAPVAQLRATPVNPSTTPGLSAAAADATAGFQQNDFWAGYGSGGAGGLKQLSSGTAQMVDGLEQLLTGLEAGVSGANQLADGSAKAASGSQDLTAGLKKIHNGQSALTGGLSQIHGGQVDLSGGLQQIRDGLAQLAWYKNHPGLHGAVVGVRKLNAGVAGLLNGIRGDGTVTSPGFLLDGSGTPTLTPSLLLGLMGSKAAIDAQQTTLFADLVTLETLATAPAGSGGDAALQTLLATDPAFASAFAAPSDGLLADLGVAAAPVGTPGAPDGGALAQVSTGLGTIIGGLQLIGLHLDHGTGPGPDPTGVVDPVGITGGLEQLLDPTIGLPAAVAGIHKLYVGSKQAFNGSNKLAAGSGKALTGSQQLTAGSGKAVAGSESLASGLGQIATGNKQVADGLPPAVDGVKQLRDGAVKVHDGINQVSTQAVGPLLTQLQQSSQNQHLKVATLEAAAAMTASAPGGPNATYVLSQSPNDISLAASTSSTNSHTGRNVGLGILIGGVLFLIVGAVAGYLFGRQRRAIV